MRILLWSLDDKAQCRAGETGTHAMRQLACRQLKGHMKLRACVCACACASACVHVGCCGPLPTTLVSEGIPGFTLEILIITFPASLAPRDWVCDPGFTSQMHPSWSHGNQKEFSLVAEEQQHLQENQAPRVVVAVVILAASSGGARVLRTQTPGFCAQQHCQCELAGPLPGMIWSILDWVVLNLIFQPSMQVRELRNKVLRNHFLLKLARILLAIKTLNEPKILLGMEYLLPMVRTS